MNFNFFKRKPIEVPTPTDTASRIINEDDKYILVKVYVGRSWVEFSDIEKIEKEFCGDMVQMDAGYGDNFARALLRKQKPIS
jgi:hypothetical protein